MADDLDKLAPVLAMGIVAALILIWAVLPRMASLPRPRGLPLTIVALLGPIVASLWMASLLARDETGTAFDYSMVVDDFSAFFTFVFAGVSAAILLASRGDSKRVGNREAEFSALVLFAAAGMMLLAASRDLILIFIALELTSISQYIMAGLNRDEKSSEAGLKYLLLGATASAVILYGMAFLFGLTGTTRLVAPEGELSIATAIADGGDDLRAGLVLSIVFLIAGLGFKMSVVPFQMWAPDVYEGSPTPVAAFLSVASKAAAFSVALRIFFEGLSSETISNDWADIFAIVAAVSMFVGNVMALGQSNIKRLLGYSSIAQAGNFMVGLAAISAADGGFALGASGVLFFVATYAFTNLAAFIAVIAISDRLGSDQIADYAGIGRRAPFLAGALGLAFISLTGIPPLAGFWAKLYVFNAAIESDLVWLVVIGALNSVISAFYYLRVTGIMFSRDPADRAPISAPPALLLPLAVAAGGVILFGVVPSPLIDAARNAAEVLVQAR
jgi:NADH-quinone oxidoreductase subunit N